MCFIKQQNSVKVCILNIVHDVGCRNFYYLSSEDVEACNTLHSKAMTFSIFNTGSKYIIS
jgi:hypothetical protein